jgi:serine O-acetyltransferase
MAVYSLLQSVLELSRPNPDDPILESRKAGGAGDARRTNGLRAQFCLMERRLETAAQAILDSYHACTPAIHHLQRGALPSRDAIIKTLLDFRELVFPGYYGMSNLDAAGVRARVRDLVSEIDAELTRQTARCLCHSKGIGADECAACGDCQERAREIVSELIDFIPELRALLAEDVDAAYVGDPAAHDHDEIILSYPCIQAIMVHRIAHRLYRRAVPLIPRIMSEYVHGRTGIDIHPGAEIGRRFFIDHGTGVVVGGTAVIGNNVKIYQGVTLGALSFQKDADGSLIRNTKRHPTIEDDVVIYSGATILGGDTVIGRGCVIGGNVWLTRSVPPGSKVVIDEPEMRIVTRSAGTDPK